MFCEDCASCVFYDIMADHKSVRLKENSNEYIVVSQVEIDIPRSKVSPAKYGKSVKDYSMQVNLYFLFH